MSKTEWKEYEMSELIEEISMGPFGSNIKVECFMDSGVPVLNGSNLVGFRLNEDTFNYVTEEKATSLGKANAYRGDIVITHRGTLGQIVYIPQNSKYSRYVISQSQFRVRCNEKVIPEYLVYYFHSRLGQHKLLSNASQVGVPSLARPTSTFQKLTISIPPIAKQKEIVKILSSLDDKIELNNAINRNLEEQAQAIFKSWFVDFEPFGGEMPSDWKTGSLSDIADYLNGLTMQKFRPKDDEIGLPVLKIKELRQGFAGEDAELCSPNIKSEYIVNDGDVIFSWSGSLLVDLWCGGKCGLNQHLFKVTSKHYDKWFYYMWTKHHLDRFIFLAADKATTMGHIKREELDKAEVCIPSKADYNKIGSSLEPMIETIIAKRVENQRLTLLRDKLLPKLMSNSQ
ncbi:MAG: restriction endonuclease subunit S [Treponema sp.]|nr:restriction endonuclease subunit S [Treponema sp.]